MDEMRSSNPNARTRRELARLLNRAVDRALLSNDHRALKDLLETTTGEDTTALCTRIARRASLLARHRPAQGPAVISARDRRILEIFAHRAPNG